MNRYIKRWDVDPVTRKRTETMLIINELTVPPTDAKLGDMYFDLVKGTVRIYNGDTWGTMYSNLSEEAAKRLRIQEQFDTELKDILNGSN